MTRPGGMRGAIKSAAPCQSREQGVSKMKKKSFKMSSSALAHSAGPLHRLHPGPLKSLKIVIRNLQFLQHVQAKTPICVPGASLGPHHRNMEMLYFPANSQYFTIRPSRNCQKHPRGSPNRPKMSQGLPQGPSMTQDACPRAPLMHPKLSKDRQMARR
jgi:hypothetical protein